MDVKRNKLDIIEKLEVALETKMLSMESNMRKVTDDMKKIRQEVSEDIDRIKLTE